MVSNVLLLNQIITNTFYFTGSNTPRSFRSSSQGGHSGLTRCESMDFKKESTTSSSDEVIDKNASVRLSSKLWQSARKCSDILQKKWRKKSNNSQSSDLTSVEPPVIPTPSVVENTTDWPQVTRRGRRPLSAVVTSSKHKVSTNNIVISEDPDDDSDSEQEARRLLRSQIIKSFWEQHDAEEISKENPADESEIR